MSASETPPAQQVLFGRTQVQWSPVDLTSHRPRPPPLRWYEKHSHTRYSIWILHEDGIGGMEALSSTSEDASRLSACHARSTVKTLHIRTSNLIRMPGRGALRLSPAITSHNLIENSLLLYATPTSIGNENNI